MEISNVAEICKTLSDGNRIRIIEMMTNGEKCGCELLEQLQITQPTLSHHMKVLESCGLVKSRKAGKWTYYSINCDLFRDFKDYIGGISCCESTQTDTCSCHCCDQFGIGGINHEGTRT